MDLSVKKEEGIKEEPVEIKIEDDNLDDYNDHPDDGSSCSDEVKVVPLEINLVEGNDEVSFGFTSVECQSDSKENEKSEDSTGPYIVEPEAVWIKTDVLEALSSEDDSREQSTHSIFEPEVVWMSEYKSVPDIRPQCVNRGNTQVGSGNTGITRGGTRGMENDRKKERCHYCPLCGYNTTVNNRLKWHMQSRHSKMKPKICPYCDYRTIQSSHLRDHIMAKHTYEKPKTCPYCDYGAVKTCHLKRHLQLKHPEAYSSS